MSTVLPVQTGTNVQTTATGGAHVARGANGRINVISGTTGSFRIYSALPTDAEFVKTTDIATTHLASSWDSSWHVAGDYLHLIWTHSIRKTSTTSGDFLYYRRISLSNGAVSNSVDHELINSGENSMLGPTVRGATDGSAIITINQNNAYRTMGTNYRAPILMHISTSGTKTNNIIAPVGSPASYSYDGHMYYDGEVFCNGAGGSARLNSANSYNTLGGSTPSGFYLGRYSSTQTHWPVGDSFYDSTNARQYCLIDGTDLSEYQEGYWTWDSGTSTMGATTLTFAALGSKPILGYHVDTSTSTRRIAYIDSNTVTVYANDGGGWSGFVSYQNTSFASQKANMPVGIYDSGSGLRACAVFGNDAEGFEIAFDIELVSIGSVAADINAALSQTISQTIAAALEHGGAGLSISLTQAISQAISSSMAGQPLELQQGFETRYQANEPGALLERNIYRAYVGATEFTLYSISASFTGLDAVTSDTSGSAYISLKAPISQRDWLTSQIGQEFIVLNGLELAGVFQGVEFVRGTIDAVRARGDYVEVTASRSEQFSAGVVITIDTGIEFVSRQRIRFGRINPTLRPGARVITPRGTYDIATLTYFVGPNQKFMEIAGYG